jgi:hypothetical protein
MKKKLQLWLLASLLLLTKSVSAQISITYPSDRAIFQRNNSNEATVYIAGYFSETFTSIEARFTPISPGVGEGEPSPADGSWALIQSSPTGGNFYGSLKAKGGWYRLEVRGLRDGYTPKTTSIDHVGVGEVFVVAGQSNSTGGDTNPNGPGAKHDQVNSVNYQNYDPKAGYIATYSGIHLPCPLFVHLDATTKTAPFGNYAWCWGSFGDKMFEKLKVPIMIFNGGWSSTDIENWRSTIDTSAVTVSAFGYTFPAGLPFGHLRVALNNYIAQLGVRAVLWHQGESDNLIEQPGDNTYSRYLSSLWQVIGASRSLSEKSDLAWVVARASRYTVKDVSRVSANVVNAQNELINNDAAYKHIYQGPETDPYYSIEYRHDMVHFRGDGVTTYPDGHVYSGLISLAGFWADKITNTFLSQSVPYAATPPIHVIAGLQPGGAGIVFTGPAIPNAQYQYKWFSPNDCDKYVATNSPQLNTSILGSYQLKVINEQKNTVFSPILYFGSTTLPVTWQYFNAKTTAENRSLLEWATTSETNALRYEVERSIDAKSFEKLISVPAAGDSKNLNQYSYQDESLPSGIYYYRLRQVDNNENFDYSRIVQVKIAGSELVKLYPNPVADKLTIDSEIVLNSVEINNLSGERLYSSEPGNKHLEVDMNKIPSGLYTVTVNGTSYKIVK